MKRYEVVVDVEAGAGAVWRALLDVERWPELTSSIDRVTRLDGGELRVGSTARVKQPRLPALVWRVAVLEPDREFTWEAGSPGVRSVARHLIEPAGEDRCRLTLVLEMSGFLEPLVRPLIGGTVRRYVGFEADGLKRCAET